MPEPLMIAIASSLTTLIGVKMWKIGYRIMPYVYESKIKADPSKYILITGATDGIGKEYAKYFSKKGFSIILCGRNQKKIQLVRSEISYLKQQNCKVKEILIDFSNFTNQDFRNKLIKLNIPQDSIFGVINCCGIASLNAIDEHPQKGTKFIPSIQQITNTNISPLQFFLTQNFYLSKASQSQYSPFLINISSMTARYPLPYSAHYSGSKAYTSALIDAYNRQNNNKDKYKAVLNVEPWYVKTKMIGNKQNFDTVLPEQLVEGTMRCLGKRKKCAGSVKHQIIDEIVSTFYRYQFDWIDKLRYKYIDNLAGEKYGRMKQLINTRQRKDSKNKK